jgi:hypothetical protein
VASPPIRTVPTSAPASLPASRPPDIVVRGAVVPGGPTSPSAARPALTPSALSRSAVGASALALAGALLGWDGVALAAVAAGAAALVGLVVEGLAQRRASGPDAAAPREAPAAPPAELRRHGAAPAARTASTVTVAPPAGVAVLAASGAWAVPAPGGVDRGGARTWFRRPDRPDLQPDAPLP